MAIPADGESRVSLPPMRLYDSRRGAVVPFEPGPVTTIYVCGVTPYDATHLGHAATYLTYDVLQRRLIDRGHEVRYVRNITDVDDDLLAAARARNVHYLDLAFEETARFDDDMAALNTLPPWSEPRATGAIANIRGLIDALFTAGVAYAVDGWVYFDTAASDSYGTVASLGPDRMRARAAEVGEDIDDRRKRTPLDFVLWQPSNAGEPAWESRWGSGRPGWHVECAALALRELGPTIDLHGGGIDLIHPHHEAVAAQCRAATGEPFVHHWLHQEMVHINGRKMSKSSGNLRFLHDLRLTASGPVIRLALMAHHYRVPWNWTDDQLVDAQDRFDRWRTGAVRGADGTETVEQVRALLDADLDVPAALDVVDNAAADGVDVSASADLLGVDLLGAQAIVGAESTA